MVAHQGRCLLITLAFMFIGAHAQAQTIKDLLPSPNYLKNIELSVAGGFDWYNTSDTHLVISSFEIDKNEVNKNTSIKGTWKAGLGYYLFAESLRQRSYLNHLLLELNFYQTFANITGDVVQFEFPPFNNYHFEAPVRSNRLMFDFKPSLFTWKNISPYPILGVGVTWNIISYEEKPESVGISSDSVLILSEHTTAQLAWDVGVGINIVLSECISITAEYIYAFLGNGSPASHSNNGVRLASAPNFSLEAQSLLLGFSLKL